MGRLNLLKGAWEGKVGETVGAKWKNKSTIRTYSVPADPKTEAQEEVRRGFGWLAKYTAIFADLIKYKSSLKTEGMSVRNAIIKLNRDEIKNPDIVPKDILINKGGLQKPFGFGANIDTTTGIISVSWTPPTATNFTSNAKMIIVAVNEENLVAVVSEASYDEGTATLNMPASISGDTVVYGYYLDTRGSCKTGSVSVGLVASTS